MSPHLIREFEVFAITNNAKQPNLIGSQTHNREGYRNIRRMLAKSYDVACFEPDIQIVDANMSGNRELKLIHTVHDGIQLNKQNRVEVLNYIKQLWGYDVRLMGLDQKTGAVCYVTSTAATTNLAGSDYHLGSANSHMYWLLAFGAGITCWNWLLRFHKAAKTLPQS